MVFAFVVICCLFGWLIDLPFLLFIVFECFALSSLHWMFTLDFLSCPLSYLKFVHSSCWFHDVERHGSDSNIFCLISTHDFSWFFCFFCGVSSRFSLDSLFYRSLVDLDAQMASCISLVYYWRKCCLRGSVRIWVFEPNSTFYILIWFCSSCQWGIIPEGMIPIGLRWRCLISTMSGSRPSIMLGRKVKRIAFLRDWTCPPISRPSGGNHPPLALLWGELPFSLCPAWSYLPFCCVWG